jgi:Retrotransposon gag protein
MADKSDTTLVSNTLSKDKASGTGTSSMKDIPNHRYKNHHLQNKSLAKDLLRSSAQAEVSRLPLKDLQEHSLPSSRTYQPQTMATPATNQGEGGALYRAPPPFFRGDSKEADRFLLAFKGWRAVNSDKRAMMNPYSRVTLILTFIDSEDVQDWKEHELDLLNEQITNGHTKTEEYLWNEFEQAVKAAFKDSSKILNAQTQLHKLLQDKEGVERYIVKFNCLLKQAGFDKDNKGSVNLFWKGLIPTLHESCIWSQPQPVSMQQWQDTAKKEHQIFREIQHVQFQ